MELKHITGVATPEKARVRLEVGARVFVGDLQIRESAFKNRVSDVLNDPSIRFLALVDVECLDGRTGQVLARAPFILIRVDAIDVLVPLVEPSERPATS